MHDHEIIALYETRNEQAVAEMQARYGNYGFSIAYNILGSSEDAEECVNDGYLRLWNSIPPKKPEVLCAFWGKIVRNLALNRYKHFTAQKRNLGQIPLALSELEDCITPAHSLQTATECREITASINRFLKEQTVENRIIFIKRYWYLTSVEQISTQLQISESKVKSSLFRTRNKLKSHLLKEGISL